MLAGLRRGDGDRRLTAGGQDQDRVQRGRQEILPPSESAGHAVVAGASAAQILRQVAKRADHEPVGKLAQIVEVHHLGNQPASDDPDPKPFRHRPIPSRIFFVERSNNDTNDRAFALSSQATSAAGRSSRG